MRSIFSRIVKVTETALIKAVSEPRLMTVQLDITNACNLTCAHCYHPHHSNKGSISLSNWEDIIEQVELFDGSFQAPGVGIESVHQLFFVATVFQIDEEQRIA